MTLQAPSGSSSNLRPHIWGEASGLCAPHGLHTVSCQVEWLIDTGADVGVVQKQLGDVFTKVTTGLSASPTTGGRGIQMVTGIDVTFTVEDPTGSPVSVTTRCPIGVKSDNSGSNLIGMDQVADVSAQVQWSPAPQSGKLTT